MPMEQGDEGSPGPKVQKVRDPRHNSAKPATVPCCAVAYGVQLHGGKSQQAIYVFKPCHSAALCCGVRRPAGTPT